MSTKKTCPKCQEVKDNNEYYKNRILWDGLARICKKCVKEERGDLKERRRKNIEKIKNKVFGDQDLENLPEFDFKNEIIRDGKPYHFSGLFIAQSRSGKTTLLKHLLKDIKPYYDIIIMITESIQADIYNTDLFDFITTSNKQQYKKLINAVRMFQRETKNSLNFLVIFDDFCNPNDAKIRDLYTNGRNSNISVFQLVQDVTMTKNHCRLNSLYVFLFNQKNAVAVERTTHHFLLNFIKTPSELKSKAEKTDYLINWVQRQTQNYNSVVLNIDKGQVMKVKATI